MQGCGPHRTQHRGRDSQGVQELKDGVMTKAQGDIRRPGGAVAVAAGAQAHAHRG